MVLAIFAAATTNLSLGRSAAADPAVPALPDPVGPVLSPVVDEVSPCGNLGLGLIALDLVTRGTFDSVVAALPPDVAERLLDAYARALLAIAVVDSAPCDAIPPAQFDTTCDADDQLGAAIASVPVPSGLPLPVDPVGLLPVPTNPAPVGALVDMIAALDAGAAKSAAGALGCKTTKRLKAAPAPALGTAGGGVDLSPPVPKSAADGTNTFLDLDLAAGTIAPTAGSAVPGTSRPANGVDTTGTLAAPAATAVAHRDDTTRRNVYGFLAFLTAAAAALGFIQPRRKSA